MAKKSKKKSSRRSSRKLQKYVNAVRAQQGAVANPGAPSYYNDAVPDSSTLLAYKLLKDSVGGNNSAVFQDMLENELKYLLGGIAILKNDSLIANQMGGETMANAAKLAQVLKNKTKELDWNDRIENMASDLLYHEYSKPGKLGNAPGRIRSSMLSEDAAHNVQLDYRISGATDRGIHVNRAQQRGQNLPAIAPRGILAAGAAMPDLVGAAGAAGAGAFRARFGNLLFGY